MKLEELKKVKLGEYPTPLQEMPHLAAKHGNKIKMWIKRDDATGPAFGGNKTRKLEYVMADALEQGCTAMLTYGGPQTNHGRTTVAAAIHCGMKPILILGGKKPDYLSGNLTLDAMMGTDIIFTSDYAKASKEVIARYEAQGDKVYDLPVGGSTMIGAAAYIMAVKEIMDQCEAMDIHPKYLIATVGSLGTFGGLNAGVHYFKAPFKVIGVPVSPGEKKERAVEFVNQLSDFYDLGFKITIDDICIMEGPEDAPYAGEAYNKPDPLTRAAMFELAREEGIISDPTYTGKTLRGFLDMVDKGIIDGDSIFLHTGGAMAVWTKEHLDDMQQELFDNCSITEI